MPALHALIVEPGESQTQEADCPDLLVFFHQLHVGKPGGVADGHVNQVVADASVANLLPVNSDAVPDLSEAS